MQFILDEKQILFNYEITILYFYMPWAIFHPKMVSMLNNIENKINAKILAIDIKEFKNQIRRFDLRSLPTIMVFKNKILYKKINFIPSNKQFTQLYNDIVQLKEINANR